MVIALLVASIAAGCHGGNRSSDSLRANRFAPLDSATARRICQSPDSVIAGTKECVLLDQGVRGRDRVRPSTPVPRQ